MCNVGDDNFEEEVDKFLPKPDKKSFDTCNKCKTASPIVLLRHKDAYCRDCFLAGTTHKFKALLGKHKLLRKGDRVLVLHDSGHSGTALLHFLRTGLDCQTPKRITFVPQIVHISDSSTTSLQVKRQIEEFGFEPLVASLSSYIDAPSKYVSQLLNSEGNIKEITKENKVFGNKTTSNDVLKIYKRRLLVDLARGLNCKFVFTPELSLDVASQLLTNISLGRGAHISLDTGFCDDRLEDVQIIRPLRVFTIKELAVYNHFHNLQPIFEPEKPVNIYGSVQDLITNFVSSLQENYPATITTILKTGDKIGVQKNEAGTALCNICEGKIATKSKSLTSQDSTNFSHCISTATMSTTLTPNERFKSTLRTFQNDKSESKEHCYACKKIASKINLN